MAHHHVTYYPVLEISQILNEASNVFFIVIGLLSFIWVKGQAANVNFNIIIQVMLSGALTATTHFSVAFVVHPRSLWDWSKDHSTLPDDLCNARANVKITTGWYTEELRLIPGTTEQGLLLKMCAEIKWTALH